MPSVMDPRWACSAPVSPSAKTGAASLASVTVDGHGDRVVGGAGEPVGDGDDDDAGVGGAVGAAAGGVVVGRVGEGRGRRRWRR